MLKNYVAMTFQYDLFYSNRHTCFIGTGT